MNSSACNPFEQDVARYRQDYNLGYGSAEHFELTGLLERLGEAVQDDVSVRWHCVYLALEEIKHDVAGNHFAFVQVVLRLSRD